MNIKQYLDSTYLKTAEQAGLSVAESEKAVQNLISEAIAEGFKAVMIRPNYVKLAKRMVLDSESQVSVGTVIDFPNGTSPLNQKLEEAIQAIEDGADELDFVCNYSAFKEDRIDLVKEEIFHCTELGLSRMKIVKWIIETAALNNMEIAKLSSLIKSVVVSNFKQEDYASVFVKSSTGFFKTSDNRPNGATLESVIIMLENACPLPVKAAGGVRTYEEAVEMINIGVKRIGTSAAKAISEGEVSNSSY